MLDVVGWKQDLEEAEAEAAAEASRLAGEEDACDEKERLEPVPPSAPKLPLCLVSTVDYPQWRTVRSFKPPPHSSRSERPAEGRRHRHRRYVRADGTTRTERSAPAAREAILQHAAAAAKLPAVATARGSGDWAHAYAKRGKWESQLPKHASRQKAGQPPIWQRAVEGVQKQKDHKLGWQEAVKPWLVQMDATRRISSREKQLARARIEKLKRDKAAEMKRLELERRGRKLLKDIEFLQRSTEQRLQDEKLTEEIKYRLDDLQRSRRTIENLKSKPIKQGTLYAIEAVHIQMCRDLFDEMDADGGGCLDLDEIRQLAISLGNRLTPLQLEAAMREMDEDGGGEVDFREFYAWWCSDKKVALAGQGNEKAYSIIPW